MRIYNTMCVALMISTLVNLRVAGKKFYDSISSKPRNDVIEKEISEITK